MNRVDNIESVTSDVRFDFVGFTRRVESVTALCSITKNRFCHLRSPRDSDKLCILLIGFVATCVFDMKIVHKIRTEGF